MPALPVRSDDSPVKAALHYAIKRSVMLCLSTRRVRQLDRVDRNPSNPSTVIGGSGNGAEADGDAISELDEPLGGGVENADIENENAEESGAGGYESAVESQYTEIEQRALRHKDRARQLLLDEQVRQNTVIFSVTEIVTVKIPPKLRGPGESMRMPVRIHSKPYANGYVLISKWGPTRPSTPRGPKQGVLNVHQPTWKVLKRTLLENVRVNA